MTWPGEALIIRLWETCAEKGIGALFRPWQMRREGLVGIDLRRQELLTIAQAEKQAEEIRAGRAVLLETGEVGSLPALRRDSTEVELVLGHETIDQDLLIKLATSVAVGETIRKECNVARAIVHAQKDLEDETTEPPTARVGDDWIYRWRDNAAAVSSEELQNLWGRVLAGEVKSPGTYSLRTLNFLRDLSREEAIAIEKLAGYSFGEVVVRVDKQWLAERGLTIGFLMNMEVLGILTGTSGIGSLTSKLPSVTAHRYEHALVCHDKVLIIGHDDPVKELELTVFAVTPLGREILRLGSRKADEDYVRKVGEVIKEKGFNVRLADVMDVKASAVGRQIRFLNAVEI